METITTNTKLTTVFICEGEAPNTHVTPGTALLRAGKGYVCPQCGKPVKDCTNTLLGRWYFAFARQDLGKRS